MALTLPAQAQTSPTDQLKTSVDKILNLLKQDSLEKETRRKQIRALINERFYFEAMSQRALARNWHKATPEQQKEFVGLFSDLLEQTYIGRIEAYTNERVEFLREKKRNEKRAVVYTQIITASGEIPIYYKLATRGDQWLVYDVVIEEVSLISNYRSSYDEIIKKKGIDGLLAEMKQKVADQNNAA
jgi:phospholipid transport system substrate-binding protein